MKYINKLFLSMLVVVAGVVSCDTEELHDLNVNPQAVKEIDLNFIFTAAELGIASAGSSGDNRYIDWRTNVGMTAYLVQQLAATGGGISPGNFYTENFESNNAPFEFIYGDQLKNLSEVLRQTGPGGYDEGNKQNLRNAARILRAFSFARLTDFYGNIPYFEALEGMEGNYFPAYDEQSEIYPDLLKELDEATAALDASLPDEGFSRADIIYDGDISQWKKFGNSLMLRLAMRVSNVAPDLANTYVTKAVAGGVFESNEDNAVVPMAEGPSLWINQNGISRAFYPGDGGQPSFLSKTLVDFLKGGDPDIVEDDDPRLMIISGGIADWTANEWIPIDTDPLDQRGLPNGVDASMLEAMEGGPVNEVQTFSRINHLLLKRDAPYMIMNYAETELLKAEALERGIGSGISGTAEMHYEEGVKAAMQMYTIYDESLEVSDAEVADYLALHPYGSRPALEMIGEQLWVSKFLNWWEAWADWRRTGYPELVPVNHPSGVTGGVIPRRLRYPAQEAASNPNFAEGATLPDTFLNRVWWDAAN